MVCKVMYYIVLWVGNDYLCVCVEYYIVKNCLNIFIIIKFFIIIIILKWIIEDVFII